jgi:non-specific serine/threonine protein kinase
VTNSNRAEPPLILHLFGSFEARLNGQPLPRLRTRKGQSLLAFLALRAGGEVERDWLAALLWPDSAEALARHSLRTSLADMRRALGTAAGLVRSPSRRALALDLGGAEVDVLAFDEAVARGDLPWLERAVTLYRGPLLEGWVDEWVFQERQSREQAYLGVLETLAASALAGGDLAAAERYLQRAVVVDPLRESTQRELIQALAAGGNYAAATQVYRELRLWLHREVNAEPDPETQRLFAQVRAEAQAKVSGRGWAAGDLAPGHSSERTTERGRGAHRPPLSSQSTPSNNLPQQVTSFIGREKEMAEVRRLLATTRLLTVTGSGGGGKTRLALQVAADLLESQRDGVWLVELAPLADAALVPRAVATVLDIREQPDRPLSQTLVDFLKPKRLLLLLDNCEHLLAACAGLAEQILRSCPGVQILATSREGLNIPGETTYPLAPLSVPDPRQIPSNVESLARYEAVKLFIDRATAAAPSFAMTYQNGPAVALLCVRLDGIPLAIELAAARVKVLSVEQINTRIAEMFGLLTGGSRTALPRQQTLKATIDWSYDLLCEKEKILFRRLSVFAGGWTLEAAEEVCADPEEQRDVKGAPLSSSPPVEGWEVLDLLSSLIQKSLAIYEEDEQGRGRYRLLEPMRQYARDRLLEAGEAALVQRQHLGLFVRLAEKAEPELYGGGQIEWLMRLEREHDNLRVALAWAAEAEPALGLRLTAALWFFWETRGYNVEGRERVETTLAQTEGLGRTAARAKALDGAGELAWHQGDFQTARDRLDESIAIWRELGDRRGLAYAILHRGWVAHNQGDDTLHHALHTESLSLFQKAGDPWGTATSLLGLGIIAHDQGNYAEARALFAADLKISREIKDILGTAWALAHLGSLARSRQDHAAARTHYEESLALRRELGDKWAVARGLVYLGSLATDQGACEEARALLAESLTISREIGNKAGIAHALGSLAVLASEQAQPERAARLFAAAQALGEAIAARLSLAELVTDHDPCVNAVRTALGEDGFAAAWTEGRAMTLEEAVCVALEECEIPTTGGKDS